MRQLAKFQSQSGNLVRAHITEEQAKRVLNERGLNKWKQGKVLRGDDVHDEVYRYATLLSAERSRLGKKAPQRPGLVDNPLKVNAAIVAIAALIGLKVLSK